jgi:precorrin-2 dehydrogenase/sirohydrochlorin ferrochelatase
MVDFPVSLRLDGRPCVVIGGGQIAERKVEALLTAGARVTVMAPEVTPSLAALAETHEIVHFPRPVQPGDLRGAFLAIVASDDPGLQRTLAAEAEAERVLLNVVDVPRLCTFTFPAVHRQGRVTLAISTGGAGPGLARMIRDDLAGHVGPEHASLARLLGRLRQRVAPGAGRREMLRGLLASPVLGWFRQQRFKDIDELLVRVAGRSCSLAALGLDERERDRPGSEGGHGS